jgi:hypothetical protein
VACLHIRQLASPVARYTSFLKSFPLLANRFPAKYIAAIIGVSPETLSRAKEKWYRKEKNN